MTLEEAQDLLLKEIDDGADCPCCGQFVKVYKRKLNSNMVRFLIDLVRIWQANPEEWVSYLSCFFRGRDYNYLTHWGLGSIQAPLDDKRTSGLWKPTPLGIQFARGKAAVPSHLYVYNNCVVNASQSTVMIEEALGNKFNYQELMCAK